MFFTKDTTVKLRISHIEARSLVDGEGERSVVFFQGCPLHCEGCQNKKLWNPEGGTEVNVFDVGTSLAKLSDKVTISGGEPFAQPLALYQLVSFLKLKNHSHIIVYTGYTFEELLDIGHPAQPYVDGILAQIDILVDGRFVKELDDDFISYRGSRNQRPILIHETILATLRADEEGKYDMQIITADWDLPEVQIGQDGTVVAPVGIANDLADAGKLSATRMCGQTEGVRNE